MMAAPPPIASPGRGEVFFLTVGGIFTLPLQGGEEGRVGSG